MRNSLLSLVILGSAIMGGIIGGGINEMQREQATQQAWDQVEVVRDGTLVANPSYYADHPEALDGDVRVIDVHKAAIEKASKAVVATAFDR